MFIYENHMGGLYISELELDDEYLYCEQCGDTDLLVGEFETPQEFLKYYANEINYDHSGGYELDYIFEKVLNYFANEISKKEAIKIISENQNPCNDEEDEQSE